MADKKHNLQNVISLALMTKRRYDENPLNCKHLFNQIHKQEACKKEKNKTCHLKKRKTNNHKFKVTTILGATNICSVLHPISCVTLTTTP